MREHVVPVLATYPSIKVWVAGCSQGEEVWSLAILLEECTVKQAASLASRITGQKKNALYERALRMKADMPGEDDGDSE